MGNEFQENSTSPLPPEKNFHLQTVMVKQALFIAIILTLFYNILTNFLTQFSNYVVVQFDSFSYHNNCVITQTDRCKNAMAKLLREPPYLLFKTPMHHFGACLFFSWPIPMPENKLTNKFLFFFLISFPGKVNPVIYSNNSRCSESPPLWAPQSLLVQIWRDN